MKQFLTTKDVNVSAWVITLVEVFNYHTTKGHATLGAPGLTPAQEHGGSLKLINPGVPSPPGLILAD